MELDIILKTSVQEKYERARKKVDAIKGFHKHITAYIIVNIFLILIKTNVISAFGDKEFVLKLDPWMELNTYGTLIIWGIVLGIHGLYVYRHKFKFLKRWEERKIREIIEKEEKENR
ncbi:2TM domain-containing protein [Aureitalea sp. L0-47]|uniref:2TM domain-containing protein n=1 Tax=Aureitalea sp. L0-47 TaxID=2816962 RepID=UPI0022373357|nr:2TM domain-containing protein [Aureitalea sp. L0-47]MCW5519773.1 2TM domain-containing protein [Aureitalea sp. L0-47]